MLQGTKKTPPYGGGRQGWCLWQGKTGVLLSLLLITRGTWLLGRSLLQFVHSLCILLLRLLHLQ